MNEIIIGLAFASIIVGAWWAIWYFVVAPQKMKKMTDEVQKEAEVIKQKKLLEVKEKFLSKKNELDKEIHHRNQQIQQAENRNKQREMSLNQKQDELNRRKQETENLRSRLENQQSLLEKKEEELDARQADLINQERSKLEELSGLSAEEAKQQLIDSLKDEARTNAQAYINEIMDEAKINANKEAKRIIIQSIQRVATETAVENSVTITNITAISFINKRFFILSPLSIAKRNGSGNYNPIFHINTGFCNHFRMKIHFKTSCNPTP